MVKGRLAIVTGGGRGIGQAVCQALARDGATVVVTDINVKLAEATLDSLSGTGHYGIQLDVSNEEDVQQVFKCIVDKYKAPPTIVVNCAGILRYMDSFFDETPEAMQQLFDVNFKGTFLVTLIACKLLKTFNLPGSIVNVSSLTATGYYGSVSYGGSKAAVITLTKSVAREMGQFGIRCNVVSPGYIATDMMRLIPNGIIDETVKNCPLQRTGTPEDVAELITFLASEKSSYMNASVNALDGGF